MISLLLRLLKSDIARAVAALVAIPVVMIGGTAMAFSINPESSTIGPFHLRNYWLLYDTRRVLLWAMPLAVVGLWFFTCLFVVRAKGRSYAWSALGVFGPFGLIALTSSEAKMARLMTAGLAADIGRCTASTKSCCLSSSSS